MCVKKQGCQRKELSTVVGKMQAIFPWPYFFKRVPLPNIFPNSFLWSFCPNFLPFQSWNTFIVLKWNGKRNPQLNLKAIKKIQYKKPFFLENHAAGHNRTLSYQSRKVPLDFRSGGMGTPQILMPTRAANSWLHHLWNSFPWSPHGFCAYGSRVFGFWGLSVRQNYPE